MDCFCVSLATGACIEDLNRFGRGKAQSFPRNINRILPGRPRVIHQYHFSPGFCQERPCFSGAAPLETGVTEPSQEGYSGTVQPAVGGFFFGQTIPSQCNMSSR